MAALFFPLLCFFLFLYLCASLPLFSYGMIFIVRDDFFGKAKAIFKHMGVPFSPFLFTHSNIVMLFGGRLLWTFLIVVIIIILFCLCDGDGVALLRSSRQFFHCHRFGDTVYPPVWGCRQLSTLMFQLPVRCRLKAMV